LEQALSILVEKQIVFLICDKTDMQRPWYIHFEFLDKIMTADKLERKL